MERSDESGGLCILPSRPSVTGLRLVDHLRRHLDPTKLPPVRDNLAHPHKHVSLASFLLPPHHAQYLLRPFQPPWDITARNGTTPSERCHPQAYTGFRSPNLRRRTLTSRNKTVLTIPTQPTLSYFDLLGETKYHCPPKPSNLTHSVNWSKTMALLASLEPVKTALKSVIPDLFLKRRLNFISIHYLYLVSMTIVGSVVIFGIGDLRYIDSLFFASGAATQSGLNTVDINTIRFGQQFTLYMLAMFCNPIFIHSFVVFVRLYWFEKRFQHVVKEARSLRRTRSKSRTNTFEKDIEGGQKETGVNGRHITVLGPQVHPESSSLEDEKEELEAKAESVASSNNANHDSGKGLDDTTQPRMTRRGETVPALVKSTEEESRLPLQLSAEQHIAFLENQRNPKDKSTLRIPSPREFDRGGKPEDMDAEDLHGLERIFSSHVQPVSSHEGSAPDFQDPRVGNHITIDEPDIHRPREKTNTFPRLGTRQSSGSHDRAIEPVPLSKTKSRSGTFTSFRSANTQATEGMPYLSYEPTIGRNSLFVNLTEEQREELGGIEYRALKTLALVLIIYFVAFHVLAVICLVPWISRDSKYGAVVTQTNGQNRVWWGFFTAASAFNDLGFTLTADSMISFGYAIFPMLLMTFLIVIGNTGFPCMLRFLIWLTSICTVRGSALWEELRFLLDHPRRCFTLLFPGPATWWLFAILVILNGLDLLFFIILDLNDSTITSLPGGIRFIDGLFQASSTRTAGFSVVNLAYLHPAIQVSYLIMMYISVFPIAISMRRTNVYEEKSLGIYGSGGDNEVGNDPSYVGAHLRKQLSFDLWYVFLGLFLIAIVEGNRLQNTNDYAFTLFTVLFEIVSAYGTVGLSLGYPNINASFSAEFATLSKLVIIAMQIRGRHRGLPYELDRAILLPSESLHKKEEAQAQKLLARRRSSLGGASNLSPPQNDPSNETGRGHSSAFHFFRQSIKDRTSTQKSKDSHENTGTTRLGQVAASHQSHARSGLGNAMFRIANPLAPMQEGESRGDGRGKEE